MGNRDGGCRAVLLSLSHLPSQICLVPRKNPDPCPPPLVKNVFDLFERIAGHHITATSQNPAFPPGPTSPHPLTTRPSLLIQYWTVSFQNPPVRSRKKPLSKALPRKRVRSMLVGCNQCTPPPLLLPAGLDFLTCEQLCKRHSMDLRQAPSGLVFHHKHCLVKRSRPLQ
jgi:hypothetical protein